jgi:hypothetical protein
LVFFEPSANLLGSPLMVDFSYDAWPLTRKKLCAAAQDFVLTTFDVDLDQLWYGSARGDEVVQRDGGHTYNFAGSHYGVLPVHFHATL